jgi:glyoxylase-like metal-dependent hydrolase (beta-lactamase superfamily II)
VRITKCPQSCLLLDAGFHVTHGRSLEQLGTIDAALYTHEHPDRFDPAWTGPLRDRDVPLYANEPVCALIGEGATRVDDGTTFHAAEVPVAAYDLPHMPLVDGRPGSPNLGFLIDGRSLHPGDAKDLGGLRTEVLATPIAGPSLSARDAYRWWRRRKRVCRSRCTTTTSSPTPSCSPRSARSPRWWCWGWVR